MYTVQCDKKTQNVIGQGGKKLARPITSWSHVSSPILRVISQEPHRCLAALRRSHSGPQAARFRSAIDRLAPEHAVGTAALLFGATLQVPRSIKLKGKRYLDTIVR